MALPVNIYERGDLVRVTGTFATSTTSTGTAVDPTTVYAVYINPSGSTTSYTYGSTDGVVVKSTVGTYYADINSTGPGDYYYRIYSTGTGQAAAVGMFRCRGDHFS